MFRTHNGRQAKSIPVALFVALLGVAFGYTTAGEATVLPQGSTFEDCAHVCPAMVTISSGEFQMGSAGSEEAQLRATTLERASSTPRHLVTIKYRFALAKYDVTRAEFAAFVRETGYRAGNDCSGHSRGGFNLRESGLNWRNPGYSQTDRDPVVCVNWDDVHAYLAWLGRKANKHYRLPSEAEWEYAARAGTSTSRYWGARPEEACGFANVRDLTYLRTKKVDFETDDYFGCSDGYVHTSPVGLFLPNRFGLYDLFGNVKQWTEDCWNFGYRGAPFDGAAWLSSGCVPHITRGGSFDDPPKIVQASFRSSLPGFIRDSSVGFRVARNL